MKHMTLQEKNIGLKDKVSVLIRFHDLSKLEQLSICLFTLEAQTFPRIEPIILTQRFTDEQVEKVQQILDDYFWHPDVNARIINVELVEPQDLRTHLLNIGIRESRDSRFLAILDYDDFLGQSHYERLVNSLKDGIAAISYSGLIVVEQHSTGELGYTTGKKIITRDNVRLQALYTSPQFNIATFVLDRLKVDEKHIFFDEEITYEEDYNFHLRISLRYPSDFSVATEKVPAMLRTLRRDGSNSIVSEFDKPEDRAQKLLLRRKGQRANGRIKQELYREEFDPFVLLWTEPFPIRGGTAYSWTVYSMGLGMSEQPKRNQYGHLRVTHSHRYTPLVESFSNKSWAFPQDRETVRKIEQLMPPSLEWGTEGVQKWKDLMQGHGPVYDLELELLSKAFDVFPFQTVLTWGVNGAVAEYARATGTKHVSLELGPTRIPFIETGHCDPFGVNGDSMLSKLPRNFLLPSLESEKWVDQFVDRLGMAITPAPAAVRTAQGNGHKVVLIPLQLADDANFLLHAEQYDTFVDFLEDVVPRLVEAGWICLIRPHPGGMRADYVREDHERCHEWQLKQDQEKVIWFDEPLSNMAQIGLLRHVDAVVSVNSSMAFEAMILGTPVVVTGRASFVLDGHMATLSDLIQHRDLGEILKLQRRLVAFNLFHSLVPVGELFLPHQLLRRLDEAESIRKIYLSEGPEGLARYLTSQVRTRLVDYMTLGLSPVRVSPIEFMAGYKPLERLPPRF